MRESRSSSTRDLIHFWRTSAFPDPDCLLLLLSNKGLYKYAVFEGYSCPIENGIDTENANHVHDQIVGELDRGVPLMGATRPFILYVVNYTGPIGRPTYQGRRLGGWGRRTAGLIVLSCGWPAESCAVYSTVRRRMYSRPLFPESSARFEIQSTRPHPITLLKPHVVGPRAAVLCFGVPLTST